MKKNLLCLKKNLLRSLLLILIPFLGNAQSLTLTGTNAASHSYNSTTYTHTLTIPFYATSLTGTFKINKDGVFNTCSLGAQRVVQFNDYPSGAFMGSNGTTNTTYAYLNVTSLPIGTTQLRMYFGCSNQTLSQIMVKIIVIRMPEPQLNLTIAPYCKTNSNGAFNNYFGYHVTGTATNRTGLELKVGRPNVNACPSTATIYPLIGTFTYNGNTLAPGSSFYDCNYGGTYTVTLEYRYTTVNNVVHVEPITSGTYGWTDHSWNKRVTSCMPLLDPEEPEIKQKTAQNQVNEENGTKDKKYRIYPNPTNGEFHLESMDKATVIKSVKVFDSNNILMVNKGVEGQKLQTVNLSALRQGIYFVYVETNEGVFVEKVVRN